LLVLLFLIIIFWHKKKLIIIFLCLLLLVLGIFRFQISLPDYNNSKNIYYYNNSDITLGGTVGNIDKSIDQQKITLDTKLPGKGKVLITLPLYPEYELGDYLEMSCEIKAPSVFDDFDYGRYLSRFDIYSVCYYPSGITMGQNIFFDLKYFALTSVAKFKNKLSISLNLSVAEPASSILQALILGNRRGISSDILDDFKNAGISHMIAISGMHIAIITMIIMYLSIALGVVRQKAFWVALIIISFYVLLIGAPASAVRGAIMALTLLYAQKIGRLNYSINALMFTAFLMLCVNPKLLLYDIGFQLSFMAVLGILYLTPILKNKFKKIPELGQVKNILIITLSAQIMTLPLIVFYFHKVSLISLLANILILPVLPFLMIWGIVNSVIGIISINLGRIIGYISWLSVNYILSVARWASGLPFAYFDFKIDNIFIVIGLYLLIGGYIYKNKICQIFI